MLLDRLVQFTDSAILLPASEVAGGPGCGVLTSAATTGMFGKAFDNRDANGRARQIGKGEKVTVSATIKTAFNAVTSVRVGLVTSDNADLSTPTFLADSGVVAQASCAATFPVGKSMFDNFVLPSSGLKKYIGFWQITVGGTTTGAMDSYLVGPEQNSMVAFPGAVGLT